MNAIVLGPTLAALSLCSLHAQDAKPAPKADTAKAESHDLWLTDFEAAKAEAKKKNVDILMDFTGSDWCGWCIKLHKEVFDTPEFQKEIGKHFVLLELDFPQKKKLAPELVKQNEQLQAAFAIEGFPSIVLVDHEGKPFAQTGYQPGGAEKYLAHLGELKQKKVARDAEMTKAGKLKGVEKAKALVAALDTLDKGHRSHYADLMDQICELDADNKAGLKEKIAQEQAEMAGAAKVRTFEGEVRGFFMKKDFKGASDFADKFVTDERPEGENLQSVLYIKSMALANASDFKAAATAAQKAIDAAPKSERADQLRNVIKQFEKMADEAGKEKDSGKGKDGGKDK